MPLPARQPVTPRTTIDASHERCSGVTHATRPAAARRPGAGGHRDIPTGNGAHAVGAGRAARAGAEPALDGATLLPRDRALRQRALPAALGGVRRPGRLRLPA